jgi:mono/diheme cytochrome c family protein
LKSKKTGNTNTMRRIIILLGAFWVGLISGCSEGMVDGRWYTQTQVERGAKVFDDNCASCHGSRAQGSFNWRKKLSDGSYPPPPLDGTGHAWHHPFDTLMATIDRGGAPMGGQMPAFGGEIPIDDQKAAIAFFQSKWDKRIYDAWFERNGL